MRMDELARPLDRKIDEEGSYRLSAGDSWPAGIGYAGIFRKQVCQVSDPVLIDVFVVGATKRPDRLPIVMFGKAYLQRLNSCSQVRVIV
jgi:hypothetical protein